MHSKEVIERLKIRPFEFTMPYSDMLSFLSYSLYDRGQRRMDLAVQLFQLSAIYAILCWF